jgi:hypothetical protein
MDNIGISFLPVHTSVNIWRVQVDSYVCYLTKLSRSKHVLVVLHSNPTSRLYIVLGHRIFNEWIGKDLEGSGRGLSEILFYYVPWQTEENHEEPNVTADILELYSWINLLNQDVDYIVPKSEMTDESWIGRNLEGTYDGKYEIPSRIFVKELRSVTGSLRVDVRWPYPRYELELIKYSNIITARLVCSLSDMSDITCLSGDALHISTYWLKPDLGMSKSHDF